jgi:hypothetical protein
VPARDAQTILGHTRISTTLEITPNLGNCIRRARTGTLPLDRDEQARREALTRLHGLLDQGEI